MKRCLQDTLSRTVRSEQPDCPSTSSLTALPPARSLLRRWRVRAGVTGRAFRRRQEGHRLPQRAGFPSSPRVRLRGSDVPPAPPGSWASLCCLSRASVSFSPQVHLSWKGAELGMRCVCAPTRPMENPPPDVCWSPALRSTIVPLAPDAATQFPWRLWPPVLGWEGKTRTVIMTWAPGRRRCHQDHLLLRVLGAGGRVSLTHEDSFWLQADTEGKLGYILYNLYGKEEASKIV